MTMTCLQDVMNVFFTSPSFRGGSMKFKGIMNGCRMCPVILWLCLVLTGLAPGFLAAEPAGGLKKAEDPTEERPLFSLFQSKPYNVKRLGCLVPLSGTYAAYGESVRKGVDLALLTFKANGRGRDFRVEYRDTASDPGKTAQAVRELAEMGVVAIIGPVGPAEEAAKEAQARGIPIITLTGRETVTDLGGYVFRHFLTQGIQVKSVTDYASGVLDLKRFAMLYPDEPYGRDMARLFETEVKRRGGVLVASESYAPKTTDFGKQIKKIIASSAKNTGPREPGIDGVALRSGIDGFFIPDSAETVGLILPQLRFYDVNETVLLGTNLWYSDKLISLAGQYLQHAVIPEGFFAESSEPQVVRFIERFREAYDAKPGYVEAVAYDTALIVFHTMNREPASHEDFRQGLIDMGNVRGVTGVTSFAENGEAEKTIYLLKGGPDGFVEIPR